MSAEAKPLKPLLDGQALAVDPGLHAWVAASAGTGKTQVLAARVLRLLLGGVPPEAILCITFTKLAAAEMQGRVMRQLALWARADDRLLGEELNAIGEANDLPTRTRARRLFAQLLDAPQGLWVATIHALAQSLIGSFPVEAGVAPGFQTLDDRTGQALRRQLLTKAIEDASRTLDVSDKLFLGDLAALSIAGGEQRLSRLSALIGRHAEAMASLPEMGLEALVRRSFGLATDIDAETALAAGLAQINRADVARLAAAWETAATARPLKLAAFARTWLAAPDTLAGLQRCFLKDDGMPYTVAFAITKPVQAAYAGAADSFVTLAQTVADIVAEQALHTAVARVSSQLRVGRRLALLWLAAKQRLGVVDYDDMIAAARRLLAGDGAAAWVRYKLDQRVDHVLVDEAQDTNMAQWDIIRALTEEFFDGRGAREDTRRLFVVGDYKQAIFGFQGSDPKIYRDKRDEFALQAQDAQTAIEAIALSRNFRSLPAILDVVDKVSALLPADALDADGVPPHVAHRQGAGEVLLLAPTIGEDSEDSEEGARPGALEIAHAQALAARIAGWLNPDSPRLLPARGVPMKPQDILVLVRRRTAFSAALVAALHGHSVPVAGVDRLKLSEPLAVADLLALARFVLQPGDDLTLACLLVSPFIGLDHEQLFTLAHAREGRLWSAVRASEDPAVTTARDWLTELLSFADFNAPYEFFERILTGPLQGRKKLLARLGEEARDAIDTVLEQALAFEAVSPPSLQGFLAWIEADDVEIKRDPDAPRNELRLMTVHGAKGLQAPVVILADAITIPRASTADLLYPIGEHGLLPIDPGPAKALTGPLAREIDAAQADSVKEHWRLLYVALTRAEDLLVVSGSYTPNKDNDPPSAESWYGQVQASLTALDAAPEHGGLAYRTGTPAAAQALDIKPAASFLPIPDWVRSPAPPEARPSRPLSPSALAADQVTAPPAGPAAKAAARRGVALHALFERLPALAPDNRRDAGLRLAAHLAPMCNAQELVDEVMCVLEDPSLAALFSPEALAEAPLAAVLGETVLAGQVDRLLVTDTNVMIVDFKTGRRVPKSVSEVPPYHLAQMAAYAAALAQIFPDRTIEALLLYTAGPTLMTLPATLLAEHALELNTPAPSPI